MKHLVLIIALLLSLKSLAAEHLNILIYHHVAENTPASTSVSPTQFRSHLQLLKDHNFEVIDLTTALAKLQAGQDLPENAVAITFDDGYKNIYDNAWPLLQAFNYPFTLFVATDAVDEGRSNILSWDQLREMKSAGVSIANHSSDHGYLVRIQALNSQWQQQVMANINHAQARLEAELGDDIPKWFAYPYGEFAAPLKQLLQQHGYISFAQHSGGLWSGSDLQAIPRFAAAGIYANPKTLLTKLKSKPMPVDESLLSDMLTQNTRPILNAQLLKRNDFNQALNCFIDGQWQDAQWQGDLNFQLVTQEELSQGRHRYNCTAKAKSGNFYYWYSKPWLVYSATD